MILGLFLSMFILSAVGCDRAKKVLEDTQQISEKISDSSGEDKEKDDQTKLKKNDQLKTDEGETAGELANEYPEGSVVLSDSTTKNNGKEIINKSVYIYDQNHRLIQKVYYSQSENKEYDIVKYKNYYYWSQNSEKVDQEDSVSLNADGTVESGYSIFYTYENGQISSQYTYELSGALSSSKLYTYDDSRILLKEESYRASSGTTTVKEYEYENRNSLPVMAIQYNDSPVGTRSRFIYTYDNGGNCTEEIQQTYQNYKDRWIDFKKISWEFDEFGNKLSETICDASFGDYIYPQEGQETIWETDEIYQYSYDKNNHMINNYHKYVMDRKVYDITYIYGNADDAQELIMPYAASESSKLSESASLSEGSTGRQETDFAAGQNDENRKLRDYVIPDSNVKYLSWSDVEGLSKEELRIARNEIYARHGRRFQSEDLQEYFESKDWYHGTINPSDFKESLLNDFEKKNAELIKKAEENAPLRENNLKSPEISNLPIAPSKRIIDRYGYEDGYSVLSFHTLKETVKDCGEYYQIDAVYQQGIEAPRNLHDGEQITLVFNELTGETKTLTYHNDRFYPEGVTDYYQAYYCYPTSDGKSVVLYQDSEDRVDKPVYEGKLYIRKDATKEIDITKQVEAVTKEILDMEFWYNGVYFDEKGYVTRLVSYGD